MKKGIAIETILMLLIGIFVVGIVIYMVYRYVTSPGLDVQECRGRLTSWCTGCAVVNWQGGIDLTAEVATCTSTRLGYTGTTAGIDCDEAYNLAAGNVCTAGATGNCPNVTICRAVASGTET